MKEMTKNWRKTAGTLSVVFFLLTVCLQPVAAQQVLSDDKKKTVDSVAATDVQEDAFDAAVPKTETSTTTNNKWLLYGGGAALVIGVAAVAAGGSGGSDSSSSSCDEELVGPSIAGSGWSGKLELENYGLQAVSATITQCGNRVLIETSSTMVYGQKFEGTMDSDGDMEVWDATTGQDWTTHFGSASSTSIKLYDFVNDFHNYDELILSRTLSD